MLGAGRIGISWGGPGGGPSGIGQRLGLETPVALEVECAAASLGTTEVEMGASTAARMEHELEIHAVVGTQPSRSPGAAAPIGHHRAAMVQGQDARDGLPFVPDGQDI